MERLSDKKKKLIYVILEKIVITLITIFSIFTITFLLLEIIPGEVYNTDLIKSEIVANNLRNKYHLDASLSERYWVALINIIRFDFGNSYINEGRSVNEIISTHMPISALYGGMALATSIVVSVILGIVLSKYPAARKVTVYIIAVLISMPTFALASLLQYFLCVKINIFPVYGSDGAYSAFLPICIISFPLVLMQTRLLMNNVSEIRDKEYTIQARHLGVSKSKILIMYLLKNSLTSVLTYIGLIMADLLVGSFVVETTFNIPGLGRYFVNSITNRDFPVIMGLTLFYSILIIVFTSITDVMIAVIDYRGRGNELYEKL